MADSTERLKEMLGFDPAAYSAPPNGVFAEALKELQEQRIKVAKEKAKEQLSKAIELREKMAVAKREYQNQEKKFEKELVKLLNRLEAMAKGDPPPEEGQENKD